MTRRFQRFHFGFKQSRIEHNAVSDNVDFSLLKNSRRNRSQYIFLIFKLQRVSGIGAALKTSHNVVIGR